MNIGYNCEICNFHGKWNRDLERHKKTLKHKQLIKMIPCEQCNKMFATKTNLLKHKPYCKGCDPQQMIVKPCSKKETKNTQRNVSDKKTYEKVMESKMNNLKKQIAAERKEMEAERKEIQAERKKMEQIYEKMEAKVEKCFSIINNQSSIINEQSSAINIQSSTINEQSSTINYQSSAICDQSSTINKQENAMNYIMNRLVDAPDLYPFTNFIEYIEDQTDVADQIIHHYERKKLVEFIGDIIIKEYKKENPIQQSVWNTDNNRFTCLIKHTVNNRSQWGVDKEHIEFSKIVLKNVLDYILILMREKTHAVYNDLQLNRYIYDAKEHEELLRKMELANKIHQRIQDKVLDKRLAKYCSKQLYFDKGTRKRIDEILDANMIISN